MIRLSTLLIVLHALFAHADLIPPARWTHSMCYDTQHKTVLMFGGNDKAVFYNDLWSFSKGKWTKLSDGGPMARNKFAFAFDEKRKCAVLFGGSHGDDLLGDTWEWDGGKWKQVNVAGPSARVHAMAAFDPQSKKIILRGGFGAKLLDDTWSYDGKEWKQLSSAGRPGEGVPHGMFIDESSARLTEITVNLNGQGKERVENKWWVLDNGVWQLSGKTFPSTSSQSLQAISSFEIGSIVVLDGDDVENNVPATWWFSNGKWSSSHLTGPSPRVGSAMVWDPAEKGVILFGGFNRKEFLGDTWMWKNEKWTKVE